MLGIGAFYVAGLLPDADEAYTPFIWNASTWVVAMVFEGVLMVHGSREFSGSPDLQTAFFMSQLALAATRIITLAGMAAVFWFPQALDTGTPSTVEKNESLLPANGSNESVCLRRRQRQSC